MKMKKLIFIEVLLTLCYQGLLSYPWNNNTREHLFGTVEECNAKTCSKNHVLLHDDSSKCEDPNCQLYHTLYHVDASIQDEGFRWRNSLNFTIDGENISKWRFNPVIKWDEGTKNFVSYNTYETIDGADTIHRRLNNIACNINQKNPKIANIATAAITIVWQSSDGKYHAASEICNIDNKVLYAMSKGKSVPYGVAQRVFDCVFEIKGYSFNSPGSSYQCTEGKIVTALMSASRFNDFVRKLNVSKENNIKLIILHIHTIMDPCAICTRMLAGLSKYINKTPEVLSPLPSRDFKFLVEVSSNKSYKTTPSGKELKNQDNFAVWTGNNSHAECAGHDNNENMVIDVKSNINVSEEIQLGIPNERSKENWKFAPSFPPYIIFHRLGHDYCANKLNAVN